PRHDWLTLCGGAIGQGLPVATGAAVACRDRKVVCLEADGSAMYTLQSLWTQVREGLDVTTVIFNNRSYALLNLELHPLGALRGGAATGARRRRTGGVGTARAKGRDDDVASGRSGAGPDGHPLAAAGAAAAPGRSLLPHDRGVRAPQARAGLARGGEGRTGRLGRPVLGLRRRRRLARRRVLERDQRGQPRRGGPALCARGGRVVAGG